MNMDRRKLFVLDPARALRLFVIIVVGVIGYTFVFWRSSHVERILYLIWIASSLIWVALAFLLFGRNHPRSLDPRSFGPGNGDGGSARNPHRNPSTNPSRSKEEELISV
jgi:hypothetical protein